MGRSVAVVAVLALFADGAVADNSTALTKLLQRTNTVAKEVSKIRGLPLKKAIPNEVVDTDVLRARLVEMAAEEKTKVQTAAEGLALARWGMIPLSTNYNALLIDLLTEQIAGYYDPKTKKLTISRSAGDDPAWAEMVLAHEIDHGLQDQSFDLEKFVDLPDSEGDAITARRALVEGDGIALMIEVMLSRTGAGAPWSNPEVALSIEKAMTVPGQGDGLDKAPLAIRESLIFPYRSGLSFVAALRRRQPWSAVDAAYAKPPKSTEHILHPERYLAGDDPVGISITAPAALPGYTVSYSTVWGEFGFDLFFRSHGVDAASSNAAADGWGGDRVLVLSKANETRAQRAVGISRTEWDSEPDAIEAAEAMTKAFDRWIAGGTVSTDHNRTRWMALDGTVSWIERKGPSVVLVIGAPAWSADALAAEVWTASSIVQPAKKPAKRPAKRPSNKAAKK